MFRVKLKSKQARELLFRKEQKTKEPFMLTGVCFLSYFRKSGAIRVKQKTNQLQTQEVAGLLFTEKGISNFRLRLLFFQLLALLESITCENVLRQVR